MELSEKERLMLMDKKSDIARLTKDILDMVNDYKQTIEVKKKMIEILSLISSIASYTKSKNVKIFLMKTLCIILTMRCFLDI